MTKDRLQAQQRASSAIHNRQPCFPCSTSLEAAKAARRFAEYWNDAFPHPQHFDCYTSALADAIEPHQKAGDLAQIAQSVDWFGLNHYSPHYIRADANLIGATFGALPEDVPRTSIGWPIVPGAFHDTLLDVHHRFRLPIYVLENGTASDDNPDSAGGVQEPGRVAYLQAYIDAMQQAISARADVRGYFVWSLLDNFEWASGYSQRFGLVYVDYATQRRIPKASARWYSDLIAERRKSPVPTAGGNPVNAAAALR
jgi:beta-glucosidase